MCLSLYEVIESAGRQAEAVIEIEAVLAVDERRKKRIARRSFYDALGRLRRR